MASNIDQSPKHKKATGKLLFSIALVADSHVQSPNDAPSKWRTNNLSKERSLLVMKQVKESGTAFAIHLGDVTNPVPHLPTFDSACELAKEHFQAAGKDVYVVAGNHDVGDKISRIVPNHPIDEYSLEKFEQHWGSSWRSITHEGVLFLIINSSLVGSKLPQEAEQMSFIERELQANKGKRIFIYSHYPLFMENPNEVSLYDNIEPEGRQRLLSLLREFHVEGAIAGHVHNFFYNNFEETEMYGLLSTTFVRHDYAELFNAAPADEYGRNDTPKLGWAELKIYEEGHIIQTHRALDPMQTPSPPKELSKVKDIELHPKRNKSSALGVNLRTAWAEAKPLMYYGPVDEFARRKVRNDYMLLALWESGIRHLRVPMRDLLSPEYRDRMETMKAVGHKFTFFSVDVPTGENLALLLEHQHLVEALEIVVPWQDIKTQLLSLQNLLVSTATFPVFLACVSSPVDHRVRTSYSFGYFVSYGFYQEELQILEQFHSSLKDSLDSAAIERIGYTFLVNPTSSPLGEGLNLLENFACKNSIPISLNISSQSVIEALRFDEFALTSRCIEAVLISQKFKTASTTHSFISQCTVFLETLVDVDRGYNPTNGPYDSLYNPRLAARVMSNLQKIMMSVGQVELAVDSSVAGHGQEFILQVELILQDEGDQKATKMLLLAPKSEATLPEFTSKVLLTQAQLEKNGTSVNLIGLSRLEQISLPAAGEGLVLREPVLVVFP